MGGFTKDSGADPFLHGRPNHDLFGWDLFSKNSGSR